MNREVKFKAFHKSIGIFGVYGINDDFVFADTWDSPEPDKNIFQKSECELFEFTGFKDKNGREIYVGDYDYTGTCITWCDSCAGYEFSQLDLPTADVCIRCHRCDGNFFFQDVINDFKVIGNYFELKSKVSV